MALTKGAARVNVVEVVYDTAGSIVALVGRWNSSVEEDGVVLQPYKGGAVDVLALLTATQKQAVIDVLEKVNTTLVV